jgi:hypothetical protein
MLLFSVLFSIVLVASTAQVSQDQNFPIIAMFAEDLQTFSQFYLSWLDTQGNPTYITNLTSVGGCYPGIVINSSIWNR